MNMQQKSAGALKSFYYRKRKVALVDHVSQSDIYCAAYYMNRSINIVEEEAVNMS